MEVEESAMVDRDLVVHCYHIVFLDWLRLDKMAGTGVRSVSCPSCSLREGIVGECS